MIGRPQLPPNLLLDGERIDALFHWAHASEFAITAGFTAFLVAVIALFRRAPKAAYYTGASRLAAFGVLAVSSVGFLLVDVRLFVGSLNVVGEYLWNYEVPRSDPRTVRVEINARQWAWDVRYPGPDAEFNTEDDILLWNELRVPAGRPVHIQLASSDVVHSLFLPNLRQKMDAVPGQINQLWFIAQAPGAFEMGCTQHCGVSHYRMRGEVRVMPEGEFDAWTAEAAEWARRAFDPDDAAARWGWAWR